MAYQVVSPPIVRKTLLLGLISGLVVGCSATAPSDSTQPTENPIASAKPSPAPEAPVITDPERNADPNAATTTPTDTPKSALKSAPLTTAKSTANQEKSEPQSSESQKSSKASEKSDKAIGNRALLFSCGTENGKEILLFETDDTIDYSFGEPNAKPELELTVPRSQASTWQWKGIGRSMTYAVDVPNQETIYSVFWSADRLSPNHEIEAGVRVRNNGKTLTTVYCVGKAVNNLQGVKLKPTEY